MKTVFIGGSRKITKLNPVINERIDNIVANGFTVLVGDANGADRCVQEYLFSKNYQNVIVFCMEGIPRNNVGNWEIRNIVAPSSEKNFDYYAAKDACMAKEASYGFMMWDAKSNGTLNNIVNLLKINKKVLVYFSPDKECYKLRSSKDLSWLLSKCDTKAVSKFEKKLGKDNLPTDGQSALAFA